MARRVVSFTIEAEGRDQHKCFQLTEMSAVQAERWAFRAFQALARAGIDVGEVSGMGMQGLVAMGLRAFAFLPFQEAEILLEEMFACVKVKPDPKHPNIVRELVEDDIEEIQTRLTLRMEIWKLHGSFLTAAALSTSASTMPTAAFKNPQTSLVS